MPITRRRLLGATLALPAVHGAHAARRSLTIAAPAGIFQQNYETAVIDPFRRRRPDVEITYYPTAVSEQILSLMRSRYTTPPIDVALLELTVAKTATAEGLLAPVTAASLPGVELPDTAFTPGVAGPAAMLDCLAIAYSPQRMKPPTSWRVLWDRSLAGKLVILPAPDWSGVALTLIANALYGGNDYRDSLETGINAISNIAPGVATWYPIPDIYSAIINGGPSIGVAWNAEGQMRARRSGGKLAMALPIEGSVFQVTTINLAARAKGSDAALAFIAYALGVEAQQATADHLSYTPVNAAVELGPVTLARTSASPARRDRMMEVDWLDVALMRERIARSWRQRIIVRR